MAPTTWALDRVFYASLGFKTMLNKSFFDQDAAALAVALLGKVLRVWYEGQWLAAQIIETEAYYIHEKASHASLGYTEKRKALFMPPGTIYMYYSRAGDSMNVSARGEGNAVLIKSGVPYLKGRGAKERLAMMQALNPKKNSNIRRDPERLCSGQTLLCKSLGLTVKEWDQQQFHKDKFYIEDVHYVPENVIQTERLGISKGRDEHLLYRFIDVAFIDRCTKKPTQKK